jgi:hypothetical protein
MTLGSPPRDLRRRAVLHPPDALLYSKLSPRRRAVSALIVGAGLALAAAFLIYGVMTLETWPLATALASVAAGLVLGWTYKSRVRRLQIVEDHARAMAIFDAFDGRLELGRVVLTDAGIELDGEQYSWAAINAIDATIANARSERAILGLDATQATRQISVSLTGLPDAGCGGTPATHQAPAPR